MGEKNRSAGVLSHSMTSSVRRWQAVHTQTSETECSHALDRSLHGFRSTIMIGWGVYVRRFSFIAAIAVFALVSSVGLVGLVPRAQSQQMVIIDGRGFGHGVGMAQDGAYWMGRSGQSASQILQTFFPGTTLAKRGGAIRVPLGSGGSISLHFPAGGRIGSTKIPAGGSATVSSGGSSITYLGDELVQTLCQLKPNFLSTGQ